MFNPTKMFQLVFIALFFMQLPLFAEAKAKASVAKSKAKVNVLKIDTKKVKVSFDAGYYYQLNAKNRKVYLQEIQSLAVELSKKSKNKRGANAWLDEIIFEKAHADQVCFSGGISYRAETCGILPSSFAIADTSVSSCGEGQQRCSLVFGLDASNKTFCYNLVDQNIATSKCVEASDAAGGVARLNEKLTRCEFARSAAGCSTLIASAERDTRSLDGECSKATHGAKDACNTAKARIAKLHPVIAREAGAASASAATTTSTPVAGAAAESCVDAEQKMADKMLGEQFDTKNVNQKWLRLLSLSAQSCGSNLDLESQLKKFGACTSASSSSDVSSDIRNNAGLQSAISAISTRGVATASPAANEEFKKYFGISASEFETLFCKTANTQAFSVAAGKLKTDRVAGTAPAGVDAATYNAEIGGRIRGELFNLESFESVSASMPASETKTALANFHDVQTRRAELTAVLRDCVAKAASCTNRERLEKNLNEHTASYNLTTMKADLNKKIPVTESGLTSLLGAANYKTLRDSAIKRELGTMGTVSADFAKERAAFQKCAETSISESKDAAGNAVYTSNYANTAQRVDGRRNKNCSRQLVDNIINRPADKHNFIVRLVTNPTDNLNFSCQTSDGKLYGPSKGLSGCHNSIKLEPSGSFYCVDKPESYIAYTYSCRNASGNPELDQTAEEAADAAVK